MFSDTFRSTHVPYAVGLAYFVVIPTSKFLWMHFLRPKKNLRKLYGGTWAIVTGCSAGIGYEIAKQLANEGINIVLVARDKGRLIAAAAEIESSCGVETRIVSIDAGNPSSISQTSFQSIVEPLHVSMLINNVGVHNDIPANIQDMLPQDAERIITVNCLFHHQLTALMIPIMKKISTQKSQQQKSLIVNISSLTSQMVMPMLSVYAGTKAFHEHWSECVAAELAPFNIEVLCLRPGLTVSRMSGIATPTFICPLASDMARACIYMFGRGIVSCAPYWPHALLDVVNGWIPSSLAWGAVRDMHEAKRQELLAKNK